MASFNCNYRKARNLTLLIVIVIVATYGPVTTLYTLSPRSVIDDTAHVQGTFKQQPLLSATVQDFALNGEATNNSVPEDVGILFHDPTLCSDEPNLKYIIYVHTAPGNVARRQRVRATWANKDLFTDRRTKLVFFTGLAQNKTRTETLIDEFDIHKDIVVGNFTDHYKNLTLKAVMALKWLTTFCGNADYAIKADDDAFVNIFEVMRLAEEHKERKRLVICPLYKEGTMHILRKNGTVRCMKWCVKDTEFPGQKFFPEYCAGLSYLLSREVISQMYEKVHETPFFWIDDVYITGLLLGKVKDVEVIDVHKNLVMKEDRALSQYTNVSRPITYYYTHVRKESSFFILLQAVLERLPMKNLSSVNESVFVNLTKVKQRLLESPAVGAM